MAHGHKGAGSLPLKLTRTKVRGTQEDLRGRVAGTLDACQMLLSRSVHTMRRTAQLKAVKADGDYPQ